MVIRFIIFCLILLFGWQLWLSVATHVHTTEQGDLTCFIVDNKPQECFKLPKKDVNEKPNSVTM
jgi:hypothetical protein